MTFWFSAIAMTVAVAALLLSAFFRAGRGEARAASDVRVYKDQLAEVERDLARGVLTPAEAEAVRLEVSRRLLEADRHAAEGADAAQSADAPARAPRTATLVAAALSLAVVTGGALALYQSIGAPGYPDLPLQARIAAADEARANRPSQEDAEAEAARLPRPPVEAAPEYLALMERLREAVAARPDDLQGHMLLARNEATLGNFVAARQAQARVLALKGETATAADYADHADLLVLAAGGYVSPEAEAVLAEALTRDRTNGTARYYSGLLLVQTGRPDLGFRIWRALLEQSAPGDPWIDPIRAQIEDLAVIAGETNFTLPPLGAPPAAPLRGPTAGDVAAAADMTPEEREQMIRGMVAGLSDRLATEGGPPEEWARLIGALGVLGEVDQARAIADEAETVFADDPLALAQITEARARAGLE